MASNQSTLGSSLTMDCKNDLFNGNEALKSNSHSSTLETLYAWEKKLYQQVKDGDAIRRIYVRKCSQLKNQSQEAMSKISDDIKDLYSSILVAIRRAENISQKIQILKYEELQPQIMKLLYGLMRTWKTMSECHETQNKVLLEVKSFDFQTYGKFCNDSHRLATLQLEAEVQNWRASFIAYFFAQKNYIQSLNKWLSKFGPKKVDHSTKVTLLVLCNNWLASYEKLPVNSVSYSMKVFEKDIRKLWAQQGEEQEEKKKVEKMGLAFQREEKAQQQQQQRGVEYLSDQLEMKRKRVNALREKHHKSMQETHRITWNCFHKGFSSIFETLSEFSNESLNIYLHLLASSENPNFSCIQQDNTSKNPTN